MTISMIVDNNNNVKIDDGDKITGFNGETDRERDDDYSRLSSFTSVQKNRIQATQA